MQIIASLELACLAMLALAPLQAQSGILDLPVNSERQVTTTPLTGLPSALGAAGDPKAIFRLAPLVPGKRYEVTFTFEAGSNIGYSHAWVDGNPFSKNWFSFVGIGSGTGSTVLRGKQEKFLFTVDPASTAKELYLSLRSTQPFTVKVGLSDHLTGANKQSKDQWGYYYVTDFDADKNAPFQLIRGGGAATLPPTPMPGGPWIPIPVNGDRQATTAPPSVTLPTAFGAVGDPKALFRLGPLAPGKRYEVTFSYDGGSDIGYAHSWVDGNPLGTNWFSLVGIGSGTGTRSLPGKEEKFLFTVNPQSTSNVIYLVLRSTGKPLTIKISLREATPGLSNQSKDRWGYFYVTDFDADRNAPFLLKR